MILTVMNEALHSRSAPEKPHEKWYLRWWMVALWLATFGPFAFPALWKSKEISRFWKWFWTLAVIGLTLVLFWSTWTTAKTLLAQFKEAGLYY